MTMIFPHCDARILHSPGECEHCDGHPDWQRLRAVWGIAYTGHDPDPELQELPCPADFRRPPGGESDHRRWGGNVATSQEPVNETAASRIFYGGRSTPPPPTATLRVLPEA